MKLWSPPEEFGVENNKYYFPLVRKTTAIVFCCCFFQMLGRKGLTGLGFFFFLNYFQWSNSGYLQNQFANRFAIPHCRKLRSFVDVVIAKISSFGAFLNNPSAASQKLTPLSRKMLFFTELSLSRIPWFLYKSLLLMRKTLSVSFSPQGDPGQNGETGLRGRQGIQVSSWYRCDLFFFFFFFFLLVNMSFILTMQP